jgi:hypothetical protein
VEPDNAGCTSEVLLLTEIESDTSELLERLRCLEGSERGNHGRIRSKNPTAQGIHRR